MKHIGTFEITAELAQELPRREHEWLGDAEFIKRAIENQSYWYLSAHNVNWLKSRE